MHIRKIRKEDAPEWLRMRLALWPEYDPEEIENEVNNYFNRNIPEVVFVAVRDSGKLCGFIEASTRVYANGCNTSPVGYIEGCYTDPDVRRTGIGRMLIEAAEAWAVEQGYKEMGSDCDINNDASLKAHLALGYEEKERVICFCKRIA